VSQQSLGEVCAERQPTPYQRGVVLFHTTLLLFCFIQLCLLDRPTEFDFVFLFHFVLKMSHQNVMEEVDFEPRFIFPFSCLIVGPSGCGKTYFVKNVLESCEHAMNIVPENIVWIYTSFQPMYSELQRLNKKIKFVEGLPDSFGDENLFPPDQKHLIILDNVIFQASDHPDVLKIFTQYHHQRHDVDSKCVASG